MPVDVALVKHTLALLATVNGSSLPEETIAAEVEIRASRPLTTQQVKDVLTNCRQMGWVEMRLDDFRRQVWCITDAGLNKQRSL